MEAPALGPQPGPQTDFFKSNADIVIFGGSAGVGKTAAILLEPLRYADNPGFNAIIFRRKTTEITTPGGLWDEAHTFYMRLPEENHPKFTSKPNYEILFNSGAKIKFSHLEYDDTRFDHHGGQYCLIEFDELTSFCVTDETEVLTGSGWKNIKDCTISDVAMSLNKDGTCGYKKIMDTQKFEYHGPIISTSSRKGMNFDVTPNHKMVTITQKNHRTKTGTWQFCEAKDLPDDAFFPRTGKWKGLEGEFLNLPNVKNRGMGSNQNSVDRVPLKDWFYFMGWYLAEGSVKAHPVRKPNGTWSGPSICISQYKRHAELEEALNRIGFRYKKYPTCYMFCSRQLYELFKDFGHSGEKRIPRWMLDFDKEYLELMLRGYLQGDGYKNTAMSKSKQLIDDMQELCFKIGKIATVTHNVKLNTILPTGKRCVSIGNRISISRDSRTVTEYYKPRCNLKEVRHDGFVYCISVEDNHNFLARTRGTTWWSGNSEVQFWYLLSRNRSMCGVRPYVRCSTNPDADSWVKPLIAWWLDEDTGYPRYERSGILRYFTREDDKIKWVTKDWVHPELGIGPKSLTFIPGKIDDNKILMAVNPQYKADLLAQSHVDMERLLKGNWNVRSDTGMFDKNKIEIIDAPPTNLEWIRYWDRAATERSERNPNPDETAGARVAYDLATDTLYIDDVVSFCGRPSENETIIKATAEKDSRDCTIVIEEEPGSSGKDVIYHYKYTVLKDFVVIADRPSGDKVFRAKTWAGQVEHGRVKFTRGEWNKKALDQISLFPPQNRDTKRDIVDAISGAKIHLSQNLKVFPFYRVNHRVKFDPVPGHRMAVLWQEKDMMVYGICVLWSPLNQNLYLYDEFHAKAPSAQKLSQEIRQKAAAAKVFANDPFFGDGASMAYLLRQAGVVIYENRKYDESASITVINYMMQRNMIKVHPACVETDRQFREWQADSHGPKQERSGCCRALTYIVSELRGEGRLRPQEPTKGYSREKQNAYNAFRQGNQAFQMMDKRYKKPSKHWMS